MTTDAPRTAAGITAAIAAGELRAEEAVTAALERIGAREPELHAWAHLDADRAIADARALDVATGPQGPRGPLHGVPIGVKDIVDVAGMPTAHGSPIYAGNVPTTDAVAVARLRAAGAIVVGKTVTTEFALFQPGPTRHPVDPARTPGGSSSGSAAATGAGTVPLAIGTQTAGSVVRPASFCGVVGAKPTVGAIPLDGVKLCSHTLDTLGLLGGDVGDVALGLGIMADDPARFRPARLGERPRVGWCRTFEWDLIDPPVRATLEAAVERLARHLDVVEVTLPTAFAGLVDAQRSVMATEILRHLTPEREQHEDRLSVRLRDELAASEALVDGYEAGLELAARCREQLPDVFDGLDVLLAPSVLGEAPPRETTGDPVLCRAWTLLGTPTVSVPGLTGSAGLPLGLQAIAPLGRDDRALGGAALVSSLV